MAIEKILGTDIVGSNESRRIDYHYSAVSIATWIAASTSVTCTTGKVYVENWDDGDINIKIVVYDGSNSKIATSDVTVVGNTTQWYTCTFSTGFTIAKDSNYRLVVAFSGAFYKNLYFNGTGVYPEYDVSGAGFYASPPATWATDWTDNLGSTMSAYLEAETAGVVTGHPWRVVDGPFYGPLKGLVR